MIPIRTFRTIYCERYLSSRSEGR